VIGRKSSVDRAVIAMIDVTRRSWAARARVTVQRYDSFIHMAPVPA
jgi:hypothetical protein